MTMITTPEQYDRFQLVLLKQHCKLMSLGMCHSKISKTQMLKMAGNVTGKKYARGEHAKAAADLADIIKERYP